MNIFISMLRGINVGQNKQIRMTELKALYEALGLANVRTYVQSGNVVFESTQRDASRLSSAIEAQIAQAFGYTVAVLIRSPKDFQQLIDTNPFLHGRQEDPTKLHVTFLQQMPSKLQVDTLEIFTSEADEFCVQGQEVFLFCPNGYGRTKLSNSFFERKLNTSATTRNWKTVNALHQMAHNQL
jgi:uncharacterized protein (DUF1697 family)